MECSLGGGAAMSGPANEANEGRWSGKVVLITGSSGGIGEVLARRFSGLGASVLVNSARSVEAGRAVADSLPRAIYVQGDVGDEGHCNRLVQAATEEWGRLDVVVNNAGTGPVIPHGNLSDAPVSIWHEIFAVNVFGAWALTVAAAPALAEAKGSVVNITSIAGIRQLGSSIPYACSKAATNHMTELLAKTLAPDIRVNAVAPGLVLTPRSETWHDTQAGFLQAAPMGRLVSSDDVADGVLFFADSPYITGQILVIDGGFGLVR
jgi:ketoreductase RED2